MKESEQALKLLGLEANRVSAEIELPTDPNHGRGEFSFAPAHRHVQNCRRTTRTEASNGAEFFSSRHNRSST